MHAAWIVLVALCARPERVPRKTILILTPPQTCGRQDAAPIVVTAIAGASVEISFSTLPTWTFTKVAPAVVTVQACNLITCRLFTLHPLVVGCSFADGLGVSVYYAGRAGRHVMDQPPTEVNISTVVGLGAMLVIVGYFIYSWRPKTRTGDAKSAAQNTPFSRSTLI
jgi:hypothetical protein